MRGRQQQIQPRGGPAMGGGRPQGMAGPPQQGQWGSLPQPRQGGMGQWNPQPMGGGAPPGMQGPPRSYGPPPQQGWNQPPMCGGAPPGFQGGGAAAWGQPQPSYGPDPFRGQQWRQNPWAGGPVGMQQPQPRTPGPGMPAPGTHAYNQLLSQNVLGSMNYDLDNPNEDEFIAYMQQMNMLPNLMGGGR